MDESARLLIQEERMEKITLSQVNATVSHEIRNPINAIHSQNIMLKMLI
jgi:signal transduction histidine kinase